MLCVVEAPVAAARCASHLCAGGAGRRSRSRHQVPVRRARKALLGRLATRTVLRHHGLLQLVHCRESTPLLCSGPDKSRHYREDLDGFMRWFCVLHRALSCRLTRMSLILLRIHLHIASNTATSINDVST